MIEPQLDIGLVANGDLISKINFIYLFYMEKVELTIQEIWQATRPVIQKNRKKYTRKTKHKKQES